LKNPVARDEWPTHVSTNLKRCFVNRWRKYTSGRYILQMEMGARGLMKGCTAPFSLWCA
jgi:hypothetical protein